MPGKEDMRQSITLNIRYDIPEDEWQKIDTVYRSMDGWFDSQDVSRWYGMKDAPRHILASVEPGGILFEGEMESGLWTGWLTVLCARLTMALGREVHDVEM